MKHRTRHLILTLLLSVAAVLIQAAPALAGVISFSGAEQPWNQEWANWSCADASRVKQVEAPAAQGSRAYEIEVRDGDNAFGERCELGMGNPGRNGFPVSREGDEEWISWQVYLPDDYPVETRDWNLLFQIHQQGDGGCPPIAMGVSRGELRLYNSARNTYVLDTREMWHAPVQRNRWVKLMLHVKHSPDPAVGFVELYGDLDGQGLKPLMERANTHTMTLDSKGAAMTNHSRVGIYRNPRIEGTAHILFDGFTIATDQATAETGAFGEGVTTPPATQPPSSTGPRTPTPTPPPATAPPATPTTGAASTPPPTRTTSRKRRARRVVLRARHRHGRKVAHSSGSWPRVLPVYGWVKREGRRVGRRSVVIQIRIDGRWEPLSRGWLRRDGRFYITASLDSSAAQSVTLRAHVAGLGYSKPLSARI
jgi:hypothetical protein